MNVLKILIGFLILCVAALCSYVGWVLLQPEPVSYSTDNTPFSVLMKDNRAFVTGQSLSDTGQFPQARDAFIEALSSAKDLAQESQIEYKIALTYQAEGDFPSAIRKFKEIAANEKYPAIGRAYAVQSMAMLFNYSGDREVLRETFSTSPFSEMFSQDNIPLSYSRLYEFASSLYPLAIADLHIANEYASQLLKERVASTSDERRAVVREKLQSADREIVKMQNDPNINMFVPEALKRKAIVMGKWALLGETTQEAAQESYRAAINTSISIGPGKDGLVRYFYALYMNAYGAGRRNTVRQILSPLYSDPVYKNAEVSIFLKNERVDALGHKGNIRRLAGADPLFKSYLMELGWAEQDLTSSQ
jgi:tetratricopeptide (TPR) repeat protein